MKKNDKINELKLLSVGDPNIGKTTLLFAFFKGTFTLDLDQSMQGVNLFRKELSDKKSLATYALNVWDIAGHERFYSIFPILTNDITGIIVLIEKNEKIEQTIKKWLDQINSFFTKSTPRFLIALQKQDEYFDPTSLKLLKEKYLFTDFYILNTTYSIEIRTAFQEMCEKIIKLKFN